MNIINPDKLVKIRKPHVCFACGRISRPPSEMHHQVNDYDGIASVYTCVSCKELMERYPDELIDEGENIYPESCTREMLWEYQREYPDLCTIEELLQFKKKK